MLAAAGDVQEGDIIVDGGNEWFPNSQRRASELESKKIMFVGMGISGGEEGARNGPSLMPGGPKEAFDHLAPIITKCAAQVRRHRMLALVDGTADCRGRTRREGLLSAPELRWPSWRRRKHPPSLAPIPKHTPRNT